MKVTGEPRTGYTVTRRIVACVVMLVVAFIAWSLLNRDHAMTNRVGQDPTTASRDLNGVESAGGGVTRHEHSASPSFGEGSKLRAAGRLGILARRRSAEDRLPREAQAPPGMELALSSAQRLPSVRGLEPLWLVADRTDRAVGLVSRTRASWWLISDIPSGRLMRVNEQLRGDASHIAVTGVLPETARRVLIRTRTGVERIQVLHGVYSRRFPIDDRHLPRELVWTSGNVRHRLPVPLSPDLQ